VIGEVEEIVMGGVLSKGFAEITLSFESTDILNLHTKRGKKKMLHRFTIGALHKSYGVTQGWIAASLM